MDGVVVGEYSVISSVTHADEIFIAGAWERGLGGTQEVISPASEETVLRVGLPDRAQAAAAVHAASTQGAAWSALPIAERVAAVRRLCILLEARFENISQLWAVEAGMPVRYSGNLHRSAAAVAWNAALDAAEAALADEWREGASGRLLVRREPAGVVVGVLAYNGPVVMLGTKIIPALIAGCPVVVKASPESQLVMRIFAECAEQAELPAGTLSVLTGDSQLGAWLTADARVDLVSLTGGYAAAQSIIESTRGRLARTHLELGGKSAALVLPDADVTDVVRTLVPGSAAGAGQVCALLTRILVPESRHEEYVDALTARWARLVVGDPLDERTQVGPLANPAALERATHFTERAVAEGGKVVCGGKCPADLPRGYYFEPTIITDVARDAYLAHHEVFGPVTAVMTYTDVDDGIALANSTDFGLAASIFTNDPELALRCAGQLRAGSVALNTFGPDVSGPWGGRGRSGWGREGGPEGILEFTELKQVLVGPGLPDLGSR